MSFAQQKLSDIAIAVPNATRLFREYELDFCCGGTSTLAVATEQKGLNLTEIEQRLTELANNKQGETQEHHWLSANYNEVIDFILTRYHERHRVQLQELILLAKKVEDVHADAPNCPKGLAAQLQYIYDDLSQHMMKEEQILFPMIKMGNYMMARMPIKVMEQEHAASGDDLEVLKSLTNNMTPPADACTSWRTLYAGIAEFINDLMMHIHTENNILFPRVVAEN